MAGDERVLRRMVLERRLAPFYRGDDEPTDDMEECPICMLNYPGGLNRSSCCQQGICSECFLQIYPRANKPVKSVADPPVPPARAPATFAGAFACSRSDARVPCLCCAQLPILQGGQLSDLLPWSHGGARA